MLLMPVVAFSQTSTKKERNYIKEGNAMYHDKRYGDAEKLYKKALQENPASDVAKVELSKIDKSDMDAMSDLESLYAGFREGSAPDKDEWFSGYKLVIR